MSFLGTTFSFDGHSCEEYSLVLYDITNAEQEQSTFAKTTILGDKIPRRYRPLHYGIHQEEPLTFSLVCCVNEERAEAGEPLDRFDMQRIALWLTGHSQYKILRIDQPDLEGIQYRCIITELKMVEIFHEKQGIQFTVTCDSPYGYICPKESTYVISSPTTLILRNESSINDYYYPKIVISGATSVSITNTSDNGRVFSLSSIPSGDTVTVDGENGILSSSSGANLYPGFNFKFFRMVRGDNSIQITGNGTYKFVCEFPVNVGG